MSRVSTNNQISLNRPLITNFVIGSVGISGHALHGGYGFASRMWGTTLDTILEMEVVLADGSIVTTSRTQNEDLFWVCQEQAFTLIYIKKRRRTVLINSQDSATMMSVNRCISKLTEV